MYLINYFSYYLAGLLTPPLLLPDDEELELELLLLLEEGL